MKSTKVITITVLAATLPCEVALRNLMFTAALGRMLMGAVAVPVRAQRWEALWQ